MTRKSKNFGGSIPPAGLASMDLQIFGETFKVRGAMSGIRLIRVMSALDGAHADDLDGAAATEVILQFLSDAFLAEDRERGMKFMEESDPPVTFRMLVEIIQWLVEEYTGNPTEPQQQSDNGSESAGSGSTVNASSLDATSASLTDTSSSQSVPHLQPVQ